MKSIFCMSLLLSAMIGVGHADVPKKAPLTKYQKLWTESPFTAKPIATNRGPIYNPLADYVLLGVSPIGDGFRVTLINKKAPRSGRIVVESDKPTNGLRIIEVLEDPNNPLATTVRMASGSLTGTVAFEDQFLKLNSPQQAKTPATATPTPANAANSSQKKPRPRVIKSSSTSSKKP